jgi:hypothetical protein
MPLSSRHHFLKSEARTWSAFFSLHLNTTREPAPYVTGNVVVPTLRRRGSLLDAGEWRKMVLMTKDMRQKTTKMKDLSRALRSLSIKVLARNIRMESGVNMSPLLANQDLGGSKPKRKDYLLRLSLLG